MSNQSRVILITLLLVFAFGTWFLPSQAQRSSQKSAPSGKATPSKSPAAKPTTGLSRASQSKSVDAVEFHAVGFAESPPARDLPAAGSINPGAPDTEGREINELNTETGRTAIANKPSFDGALQDNAKARPPGLPTPALPAPSLTFEGIAVQNSAPPDTNADVGPNDIVETVNTLVRVYDKNGVPRGPAFTQSSLFAGLNTLAGMVDRGDPVVLYDRIANRWLISQFAFTGQTTPPYHEAIAISKTGDPTGAYYLYDFVLPGNEFPDYPKFGVWPDGYYMTSNQFLMGGGFDGAGAFAFDRNRMLVGDPTAGGVYFNLNLASHPEGIFGMLPSDHDGLLPPPAGAPNVFVYFTDDNFGDPKDGLRLFNFNFNTTVYAASTFVERSESTYAAPLPLAAFDARDPGGRGDIEQPPPAGNNATDRLDSVGSRLMFRLQYQNRGGIESLVSNFTVNVSGVAPTSAANYQAAFRYFELKKNSPGGSYAVTEQATFAPGAGNGATGDNRWMASAANDNQDNLLVGYTLSGVTAGHFPSLNYAARAFTDPPNGLFQGEGILFAGTGVQRGTSNRWGDYSSTQLDPSDDCTFWMANEYYTSTTLTFNWRTRIGKVKFPSCTAPQQGTLAGTITACDTGQPLQFALVQVSGGPSDGFSTATIANGTYSMQLAPGTYSVNVSAVGHLCNPVGPFTAVIVNGSTTTLDTCLSGQPTFVFQSAAVSGGNGNGVINLNECNNLNVTIKNDGCLTATGVSAVLSTTTPGVTITQPNSPYPNTAENASSTNVVPFSVSTSPAFVCGTAINFTLTVSYTGGGSPNTLNFSLPSCQCPPATQTGSITAGDADAVSRLGRNAVTSACNAVKACPGAIDPAPNANTTRKFHNHNFVNGPTAACATITFTANCNTTTNPVIPVAYLGSFNPSNLCTNYLGDPGGSPATVGVPISFAVNVPANGTLVVCVQEINHNQGGCSGYTVTVSGLICTTDGGGQCVPCSIVCPSNITQPNDTNQCGAIVNYPAPTTTGTCGLVACSPAAGSFFPVGTTTVSCSTTQGSSCTFTVTVNDVQPPVVTCNVSTTTLWPPLHDLVNVGLSASATDNCPGTTISVAVFGDENDEEATGDGTFSPDAKDIALGTLRLRSERKGNGDGRVYLIIVTATDAAGNVSRCCRTVTVTLDQSKPSVASVAAQAAAARAYCEQNGTAPPGYFVIGDGPVIGPKQ
ncbi:MAG TPA: carboxypeptidase regulatory-like domain-containing protein [Blastocatellia bacterium]|nr:carboxypeptidase regulatory-like domain-containing protein [Blastocatellia bacterium]